MVHLDLFSGIGGFAYAIDQVWDGVEHIFCDNDEYCRQILNKHWPESEIYDDIRAITNTRRPGGQSWRTKSPHRQATKRSASTENNKRPGRVSILTGGFPCQPFSAAGKRRGTQDDRYLWPEMFEAIRITQPEWIIAENVRGLLTWDDGMVLEQVCADLESEKYEVQPLIIPACAVNAPHRRDRIWFVAHSLNSGQGRTKPEGTRKPTSLPKEHRPKNSTARQSKRTDSYRRFDTSDWSKDWLEVATELCRMDDGIPKGVDRARQLKAYGNAIVPQVAIEILQSIKKVMPM